MKQEKAWKKVRTITALGDVTGGISWYSFISKRGNLLV